MTPAQAGAAGLLGWCLLVLVVILALATPPEPMSSGAVPYPPAPPGDQVDNYHGTAVADPWRWLEDVDSPATRAWVRAQNRLTQSRIGGLPGRKGFAASLRRLLDDERQGVPRRENGVYAYAWNPGQAEQDVLRITRDLNDPGTILVDPMAVRADGTVSLGGFELSPDGTRLAYGLSDGGSDWKTWRVRSVATGTDSPEVIAGTKFTGVSWARDGSGFYYSRYPRRADGSFDDSQQVAVYFHVPGTDPAGDGRIFAVTDHPTRDPYATVSRDGRLLILLIQDGFLTNGLYYQRFGPGGLVGPVVRLLNDWDARYDFLGNDGNVLYLLTTRDAPRGRVVAIDLDRPAPADWVTVVPESDLALEAAALAGGTVLVQNIRDAHAELARYSLSGELLGTVKLPGRGTVDSLSGELAEPDAFFRYSDFTTPRRVQRLDAATGKFEQIGAAPAAAAGGDPAATYISEQVFVPSADGTRIPLSIVRRADLDPGVPHPTVLYGYGGFGVSLLPAWSASRLAWVEAGGIYVQANLRGGGEYGEDWHVAGTRLNKQNVFDDFIAAAEWLIDTGVTTPAQLAIWGGSNGGLLVGAVLNQRPELFAAAVPAVGVMDMLRYQTASLNARKWSSDYGLSEDPAEFAVLRAYSPYHNLRPGYCYPATLVQADANDDRVVPWHSYKYAAALQAAQSREEGCATPVLIRIETRSGHGAGASLSKIVGEYADQWAFVAAATGLGTTGR